MHRSSNWQGKGSTCTFISQLFSDPEYRSSPRNRNPRPPSLQSSALVLPHERINPFKPQYPHTISPHWFIHFLRDKLRNKRSNHFLFGDHLINSRNHFSWQHKDIVRRKLMLVTLGTWRVKTTIQVLNKHTHSFPIHRTGWITAHKYYDKTIEFKFKGNKDVLDLTRTNFSC